MSDHRVSITINADAKPALKSIRRVQRKLWWFRLRWAVMARLHGIRGRLS